MYVFSFLTQNEIKERIIIVKLREREGQRVERTTGFVFIFYHLFIDNLLCVKDI